MHLELERELNRDEAVIASIESFTPHRNELIELFIVIAQYAGTARTRQKIHRFFESLTSFLEPIQGGKKLKAITFASLFTSCLSA